MPFHHLDVRRDGSIARVTLARPEARNAFNAPLIAELADWAAAAAADETLRAAVLAGAGKVFCAGADVNWMAGMVGAAYEDNLRDAAALAEMFERLDTLPVPLVGRVHGAALGGGAGLAAICDIVVATDDAQFGFTEVKLGILPAVVSPYVVARIGPSAARELYLTGRRFGAAEAHAFGLVHAVVPADELDRAVAEYLNQLSTSGPRAVGAAKRLIRTVTGRRPPEVRAETTDAIATLRVSAEGQEGLRAFLQKRSPEWVEQGPGVGGQGSGDG